MLSLFRRIPTISAPTIGFLDLTEGEASVELAVDRAAISPLFGSSEDSSFEPPRCNVLFLYCHMESDGSIRDYGRRVREVIRDAGAAVVIVASENNAESYIAGTKKQPYGHANLVMTLDRRGDVFPKFFQRLFSEMKRGVSMPVAWVKLAPQIPGADHPDCPDAIFSCEAGQLAFK